MPNGDVVVIVAAIRTGVVVSSAPSICRTLPLSSLSSVSDIDHDQRVRDNAFQQSDILRDDRRDRRVQEFE